jgi:methylenetetrahydrofolate reductase (NADPH)
MRDNTTEEQVHSNEAGQSPEQLKSAVLSFLEDFSIETTPHSANELTHFPQYLAAGTTVYVAHPPNCSFADVVQLALRLRRLGYRPVPHLVARRIESHTQLAQALKNLQAAGIDQTLVVAGDPTEPLGPYHDTMQILETGLLPQHGFLTVGIAGHPEGSRTVGSSKLRRALREKARFAAETGLRMYVVTQFGFNSAAVPAWESATGADGIELPIHVGMAGRAPLKELLRYAFRCGISASMRMLVGKASMMSDQIKLTPMDELILAFASHRLSHPDSRIARAHFFAFGSAERTARWLNSVCSGQFEIRDGLSIQLTD